MGLWNKLLGGANGCREAMRESYQKHLRLAQTGQLPSGTTANQFALYGALATRHMASGRQLSEVAIWAELAPFMAMTAPMALEALVEYVVWQEFSPAEARFHWLRSEINRALTNPTDKSVVAAAGLGLVNQAAWTALLLPETVAIVERAMFEE